MNMFIFNLALKIIEFFTIFKIYMNNNESENNKKNN